MTEHGLRQRDIARIIGYESHVSAFLAGTRNLSKSGAVMLGHYFAIDPAAFLPGLNQHAAKLFKAVKRESRLTAQESKRAAS